MRNLFYFIDIPELFIDELERLPNFIFCCFFFCACNFYSSSLSIIFSLSTKQIGLDTTTCISKLYIEADSLSGAGTDSYMGKEMG